MQIYLLDNAYNPVGTIDESESLLWNKKYNDVGECEVYIPYSEEYLSLLSRGNYIFRFDDDMVCRIDKVEIETDVENGNYIIATATDIASILSGRIVRWQIIYSGSVGEFIKKVLTDNLINPEQSQRAISYFEFDSSNISVFNENIVISPFTDDLLQLVITTCKTHNIGFRLTYDIDKQKLIFRLYKGENKGSAEAVDYVEFSPQFSNIISSKYTEDDSNYKNVAYVAYKGEDEQTYLLSLYKGTEEPQGEERRELYIDGTGVSRDITEEELLQLFPSAILNGSWYQVTIDGKTVLVGTVDVSTEEKKIALTDEGYTYLIRSLGENALAERVRTQSFEGNVDTIGSYQYKVDYDLGDIVKVKNDYGIEAEARITEVMESDDSDEGYSIEPKFEYLN